MTTPQLWMLGAFTAFASPLAPGAPLGFIGYVVMRWFEKESAQ